MNDSDRGKGIYMIPGTRRYDSMRFVTPGICQPAEVLMYHLFHFSRAGRYDDIHCGSDFAISFILWYVIYICVAQIVQLKVIDTLGCVHT